jgi:hypothetical protein
VGLRWRKKRQPLKWGKLFRFCLIQVDSISRSAPSSVLLSALVQPSVCFKERSGPSPLLLNVDRHPKVDLATHAA